MQRLLAFSRQQPLEVKSVDINRLVQGMSELLRRTIGETVTIETVLAGGLWKAAVDPNQLENAILNLAVNARDAMPDGGRLTIETANCLSRRSLCRAHRRRRSRPGQYVMLAVSDTGTGMSARGDRPRVRAVLHHQADRAGHRARARAWSTASSSSPAATSRSTASSAKARRSSSISRASPSSATCRPGARASQRRATRRARDGSETILLVEDDEEVPASPSRCCSEHGYRVLAAPTARARCGCSTPSRSIDLLFTDVVLPGGMNGRQLADEVQRRRPDLKVLFTTGYTRNAIIHHGRLDRRRRTADQAVHRRGAGAQGPRRFSNAQAARCHRPQPELTATVNSVAFAAR